MAINYKTRNNPKKTADKQSIGFKIIFFALNFLLVPFSAIATYKGYRGFLDEYLAIVLAAATGLLFFGLNFIIMERRRKGESHLKQSLGFLLPLLISFFGNFTYFYGNQMEGTLLNKDLTLYTTTLDKTYEAAKSGLNNSTGLNELEATLRAQLQFLKSEMQTPPIGFGTAAEKIWNVIIQLFIDHNSKYGSAVGNPNTKIYKNRDYYYYENTAMNYFNSLKNSKEVEINSKLTELNDLYDPVSKLADSLLKSSNEELLKLHGEDVINKTRKANNSIGSKSQGFLPDFNYTELKEYEGVNAKNIKSVLNSAFVRKDNNSATIFSIIISLVIDLATLGFVFLALSFNKKKTDTYSGPRGL